MRIALSAVQELDQLAQRFRRRLRDCAVELAQAAGQSAPVGPDAVHDAVPLVCRELLAEPGLNFGNERRSDGSSKEAR
jgi:hypothetical protein